MSEVIPLILCGGAGSGLWPLSRESHPKQFVDLGNGRTLFGDALERSRAINRTADPIVLSNASFRFFVLDELYRRGQTARIICEPMARNTAPAIALAALSMSQEGEKEENLMLVLPSDQAIGNMELFKASVEKARDAAMKGHIVAFGISPTYPACAFGYISRGRALGAGVYAVRSFVEKPGIEDAEKMILTGDHYWNAGIFLMRPSLFLQELEKYRPDIHELCLDAWQSRGHEDGIAMPDGGIFSKCAASSIDYAIMEKTDRAAVMPLDIPWNDLGSWDSFFNGAKKDRRGNASEGRVVFEDCSNCQAYSEGKLVAALGVEDLSIVSTPDAMLISKRGSGEKIKDLVSTLKSRGLYHYDHHPRLFRQWGSQEKLASGQRFEISHLTVYPGEWLSLGPHDSFLHLLVISGIAEVSINYERKIYRENQYISIPAGCEWRIKNPGRLPLAIIEIQTGVFAAAERNMD